MGIVFDLDDTILPEADYVRSGMRAVAGYCALRLREEGMTLPAGEDGAEGRAVADDDGEAILAVFLLREFEAGIRGNSFDRLLTRFSPLAQVGLSVAELIQVYRAHPPAVELVPAWRTLLQNLKDRGIRVGVISDGPLTAQTAKVTALHLEEWCSPVLLTDRWGREFWKPSPRAFGEIEALWGESGSQLCYVGDNPAKDFLPANLLGWRTIRLRLPGQLHFGAEAQLPEAAAGHTCGSLPELAAFLAV